MYSGPGPDAGKVYKFVTHQTQNGLTIRATTLSFWAEHGMVCMLDEEDGSYNVVHLPEFRARYRALVKGAYRETEISERQRVFQLCDMMRLCAAEAAKQGDPTDPKFIAWVQKHRPFRKHQVSGAKLANMFRRA